MPTDLQKEAAAAAAKEKLRKAKQKIADEDWWNVD